jgi:hypothetical protein
MKIQKYISKTGSIFYSNENSKWHREDGPAIEYANGNREWYLNGELHREDGPACEYTTNGSKGWFLNGRLHRKDGPALEYANGEKQYWLNGIRYDDSYNISSDEEWIGLVPKILLLG